MDRMGHGWGWGVAWGRTQGGGGGWIAGRQVVSLLMPSMSVAQAGTHAPDGGLAACHERHPPCPAAWGGLGLPAWLWPWGWQLIEDEEVVADAAAPPAKHEHGIGAPGGRGMALAGAGPQHLAWCATHDKATWETAARSRGAG